ncbi:hypothetical protein B0H66DRAFT_181847 [Apodospora peruviana]|uniref:Uncharacterized protein n=1 Tax=Apodospora peruviana TaxID=516989 RepID=A0AAE0IBF7_9PEZI|nr:hypothetical protein B0H66DRAFT_181847 [Apodospora peruviana]
MQCRPHITFLGVRVVTPSQHQPNLPNLVASPRKPEMKESFRLLDLPIELIGDVCSQFCNHCHPVHQIAGDHVFQPYCCLSDMACSSTLAALCLTSRTFRYMAEPCLYHFIFLDVMRSRLSLGPLLRTLNYRSVDAKDGCKTTTEHISPQLHIRPDLAEHVKTLVTLEAKERGLWVLDPAGTEKVAYDVASRWNMQLASNWLTTWKERRGVIGQGWEVIELFLGLLLLSIPKLETAHLSISQFWTFYHLRIAIYSSRRSGPTLPFLERLSIDVGDSSHDIALWGWSLVDLVAIQHLMRVAPQLHTLCTTNFRPRLPCPGLARVRNLHMRASHIRSGDFEPVIANQTRLEVFDVLLHTYRSLHAPCIEEPEEDVPDPDTVVSVLRKYHASSLRSLTLEVQNHQSVSLLDFTALESLDLRGYGGSILDPLRWIDTIRKGTFKGLELEKRVDGQRILFRSISEDDIKAGWTPQF